MLRPRCLDVVVLGWRLCFFLLHSFVAWSFVMGFLFPFLCGFVSRLEFELFGWLAAFV